MRGGIPPHIHTSWWHGAWLSKAFVFMAWYLIKYRVNFTFTLPYFHNFWHCYTCNLARSFGNWCQVIRSALDPICMYEGVSKSFRTGLLERELQMVQLSATRCSCVAILWVSLVSFAALTLCVPSQRVFVAVYFVIDSVRKLLVTPSYRLAWKWAPSSCIQYIPRLHTPSWYNLLP
jgi:hypothetical protein